MQSFHALSFGSATVDRFLCRIVLHHEFVAKCTAAYRELCPHNRPKSCDIQELRAAALELLGQSDAAKLKWHLRDADYGGALVVCCGTTAPPDAVTACLLMFGNAIGTPLPELGANGALVIKLLTQHPAELSEADSRNFHKNPYIDFGLHTDGAYHNPPPEWIALGKLHESNARGGETTLLHLADWGDLERYSANSESERLHLWEVPGQVPPAELALLSEHGIQTTVLAPVIERRAAYRNGTPTIRLGVNAHWKQPEDSSDGAADVLNELRTSLGSSEAIQRLRLEVGDIYILDNTRILHGRAPFDADPRLVREVVRLRGYF